MSSKSIPIPDIVYHRNEWETQLAALEPGQIIVNNAPNRFGKTVTTLLYYSKLPGKYLYLSDRHSQIGELKIKKSRHWYGQRLKCERKDEPFINSLMAQGLGANIICSYFCKEKFCEYKKQFQIPDDVIVVAPKEYLATSYVQGTLWDSVILDENLEKAQKITYTYPDISKDVFESYGLKYCMYNVVGEIINGSHDYTKAHLPELEVRTIIEKGQLSDLIKKIRGSDEVFSPNYDERNLISFLNNLPNTMQWIQYCMEYGTMDHFYKPYLHFAYDLLKEKTKMVILNTSFDKFIYHQIAARYHEPVVEPLYYNVYLENKDSYLFQYNYHKRSLSKNTITEERGSKFGGKYGAEILEMVQRAVSFASKRELKTGVITFKSLVDEVNELFDDDVDIVSYFGGHQGSNKFDDVDVLIIIGTYHLNPYGLYQKHYAINNEYLEYDKAKWGGENNTTINGMLVNLTDNEKLNRVKLYKLNEEHQQAIFRSGAHIQPGKLVVNFGYVPKGVEKVLKYGKFFTKNQLIGRLGRIKDYLGS